MRNKRRSVALLAAVMILMVSVLTGCSSKPTAEDAQQYTQAVLDLMCTGDYDHSVNMADIEEGQETATRDAMIDEVLNSDADLSSLSEDVKEEFRGVLIDAFAKSKYTVGEAVPTDDGGYDVTVSIEPLKVFSGVQERLMEESASLFSDSDTASMTQEEINDKIYSLMVKLIAENLENPTYDEAQEVTVHYGIIDEANKLYGINEEDGAKLGELLFSAEY